ncbi:MFS-type transporter SLC18B1-like isoform X2 [Dendronephthya gigantea]|uniref:MFS-type transporter SLC18B1-like isoform X2 n=1 Tax=Dendronephthya gigantea TaxID=151771 RepID=UPI0010692DE3|nr:MFS-type transporter SLC18B1-like isoform X2 [Dendronephthya gigantea]
MADKHRGNDSIVQEEVEPLLNKTPATRQLSKNTIKTRKKLTVLTFAIIYITIAASYSVIAPFYPTEANEKGAGSNVVGFIFGIFALVSVIVSPLVGSWIPTVGIRFFLFNGIFIIGVSEFLFGFLDKMPNRTLFITFSFVIRVFDGVGGAWAMTAAVAYLAQCFPDNVGSVMGSLELFSGLGLTLGPLIGGVLYEYGGFGTPFFVLAGLILLTLPVCICILPKVHDAGESEEGSTDATLWKFLKIPAFDIIVMTIVTGGMAIGIIEPTLAPHLKDEFNITSSTKIGLLFFLFCGCYALFAPLFGWIADKTSPRWVMLLGSLVCACSFFLLGPVPFSFMPKKLWLVGLSLGLMGLSIGPMMVPGISELENIVKARGFSIDLATHGIVSGVFGSAFNVGAFFGPTLSGVFTHYLHFNWTCTGFGCILLLQTALLLGLILSGSSVPSKKLVVPEEPTRISRS